MKQQNVGREILAGVLLATLTLGAVVYSPGQVQAQYVTNAISTDIANPAELLVWNRSDIISSDVSSEVLKNIGFSTDFGITWQYRMPKQPSHDWGLFIDFETPTTGTAYGIWAKDTMGYPSSGPTLNRTTDGGFSWARTAWAMGKNFIKVFRTTSGSRFYVRGWSAGNFYWGYERSVAGFEGESLESHAPIDLDTKDGRVMLLVYGRGTRDGILYRTVDSGKSWLADSTLLRDSVSPTYVRWCGTGRWFMGTRGASRLSTDDGVTWSPIQQGFGFTNARFLPSGVGFATLGENVLYRSTDNGTQWSPLPVHTNHKALTIVEPIDDTTAYAVGANVFCRISGLPSTPVPILRIDKRHLDFGTRDRGADSSINVRITNIGSRAGRILRVTSTNPTFRAVVLDSSLQLGDVDLPIVFSADADRDQAGQIVIETDSYQGSDTIDVSGRLRFAIAKPAVDSVNFNDVAVGEFATYRLFVRNVGYTAMKLSDVRITGSNSFSNIFDTSTNGGSTDIIVRFDAHTVGAAVATMTISLNGLPVDVALRAVAVPTPLAIASKFVSIPDTSASVVAMSVCDGQPFVAITRDSAGHRMGTIDRISEAGSRLSSYRIGEITPANGRIMLATDRASSVIAAFARDGVSAAKLSRDGLPVWEIRGLNKAVSYLKALALAPNDDILIGLERFYPHVNNDPNMNGDHGDIKVYTLKTDSRLHDTLVLNGTGNDIYKGFGTYSADYLQGIAIDSSGEEHISCSIDHSKDVPWTPTFDRAWSMYWRPHYSTPLPTMRPDGLIVADSAANVFRSTYFTASTSAFVIEAVRFGKKAWSYTLPRSVISLRGIASDRTGGVYYLGTDSTYATRKDIVLTLLRDSAVVWMRRITGSFGDDDLAFTLDATADRVFVSGLLDAMRSKKFYTGCFDHNGQVVFENRIPLSDTLDIASSALGPNNVLWLGGFHRTTNSRYPLLISVGTPAAPLSASEVRSNASIAITPNPASSYI